MLGLTKPKHFIPMHGEFRMQVQHGRLAIETGVAPENVFIIENGTPIEIFADGSARRGQPVAGRLRLRRRAVGRRGRRRRPARPARARQRRDVHDRRQVDKQTGTVVGQPEIITRGFVHLNEEDPIIDGGDRARRRGDRARRATTSARSRCSRPRSRTASRASCTSRRSAGRWSSRSWSRSRVATRRTAVRDRHAATRRAAGRRAQSRGLADAEHALGLSPAVVRSLIGIMLLVLGAVTLDRPAPARPGRPDRLVARHRRCRASAAGRWLLPFVLLLGGLVPRVGARQGAGRAWGRTLLGIGIAYVGFLGRHPAARALEASSGRPDRPVPARTCSSPLLTTPGAFVILLALAIAGLLDRVRPAAARAAVAGDARARRRRHRRSRTAPTRRAPTA